LELTTENKKVILNSKTRTYKVKTIMSLSQYKQSRMNAKQAALQLIKDNFPASKYRAIQSQREKRMVLWKQVGVDELIYNEARLIKFGKKVLRILEEHEIMTIVKKHYASNETKI